MGSSADIFSLILVPSLRVLTITYVFFLPVVAEPEGAGAEEDEAVVVAAGLKLKSTRVVLGKLQKKNFPPASYSGCRILAEPPLPLGQSVVSALPAAAAR